jgi:hypothetical protein
MFKKFDINYIILIKINKVYFPELSIYNIPTFDKVAEKKYWEKQLMFTTWTKRNPKYSKTQKLLLRFQLLIV